MGRSSHFFLAWFLIYLQCSAAFTPVSNPEVIYRIPLYYSTLDEVYYMNTSVGTPAQEIRGTITTTIGFSIVYGNCDDYLNYGDHDQATTCYEAFLSTSHQSTGDSWRLNTKELPIFEDILQIPIVNISSPFKFSVSEQNTLVYTVQAIFGFGLVSESLEEAFGGWWNLFNLPKEQAIVAFQLNTGSTEEDQNPELHIGGYEHPTDIIWSEKQTSYTFEFPLYHFSYCAASLDTTYNPPSSFTPVVVSTFNYPFTLPEVLFENLLGWLPNCEEGEDENYNTEINCEFILPESTTLFGDSPRFRYFGEFTFQLLEDGEVITLPLDHFIRTSYTTSNNHQMIRLAVSKTKQAYIIFPQAVMNYYYMVFNAYTSRVGFYTPPKISNYYYYFNTSEAFQPNISSSCPAQLVCNQTDIYVPSSNTCKKATCSPYYYQNMNEDGQCVWSPVFVGLIVAVAVVLGLAELIVTEIRLRLEYKSQRIHTE